MRIYLIYGEQAAGKTTVCRKLLKCISSLDGAMKYYDTFSWADDFKCIIEFEGKRLGIYTPGDERGHVSDAVDFGSCNNCDILIASVRKGIAYKAPLEAISKEIPIEWITLHKGATEAEQDYNENGIVAELLDKIHKL